MQERYGLNHRPVGRWIAITLLVLAFVAALLAYHAFCYRLMGQLQQQSAELAVPVHDVVRPLELHILRAEAPQRAQAVHGREGAAAQATSAHTPRRRRSAPRLASGVGLHHRRRPARLFVLRRLRPADPRAAPGDQGAFASESKVHRLLPGGCG